MKSESGSFEKRGGCLMKKRTLILIGTVIGASAFAFFKSKQKKDIQKKEKLEELKLEESSFNLADSDDEY